jgi:hypothetical protein
MSPAWPGDAGTGLGYASAMSCDGGHLRALVNVLDRLAAALEAHRQLAGRADPGLDLAMRRLDDEHAVARSAVDSCADCASGWAQVELQTAIRNLHGCESRWVETVHVREEHHGDKVWEGDVEVFELVGHPAAKRAYAWSEPGMGKRRRFFAALHVPPVDSPAKAVQGSIFVDVQTLEKAKRALS